MALDHYVSQVHLKRFYSPDLDGLMYAVRKGDLKHFTPRAEDVCRIDEGSTNKYLSEPRAVEEFLKTVEGQYNASVLAFESGKPTKEAVYAIAGFVSYLLTCSPAAMRINSAPYVGILEATAKITEKHAPLPPPPESLGGRSFVDLLESGKVKFEVDPKYPQAIGVANILQRVATFGNFQWEVLVNPHIDCPFFTSDFPVLGEPNQAMRVLDRLVPLTPTTAVRIKPQIDIPKHEMNFEFRHFSCNARTISRQEAIEINRRLVRSAEDTVFYCDNQPWVSKFVTDNRHFRIEVENVRINQPSRVVQWSRQDIKPFKRG
jgi:hypothetical protein